MRIHRADRLQSPPDDGRWTAVQFGLTATEIRVSQYAGIVVLLAAAVGGVLFAGPEGFSDWRALMTTFGPVGAVVMVVLALLAYLFLHEGLHLLAFPDRGLGDASLIGLLPWAVFVLYNSAISPRQLQQVVLRPLIVLTPPLLLIALWRPGALTIGALIVHLLTCVGDVMMHRKLARLHDVAALWTTGREVWFLQAPRRRAANW